jgi:hypothetical protein
MMRFAWAVYATVLTVFLLVPDPAELVGLSRVPGPASGRGIHFLAFAVLAGLTHAARLPIRAFPLAFLLVFYACSVETLQAFVPRRTVELPDYIENIGGLVAGATVWWIAARAVSPSRPPHDRRDLPPGRL